MGVCNCSMFCCTLLCVRSSIAIILMGKRELVALLILSSWCLAMVGRLFLAMPGGCLRFLIVVTPDHTHLLFLAHANSAHIKIDPSQIGPKFKAQPKTPQPNVSFINKQLVPHFRGKIRPFQSNPMRIVCLIYQTNSLQRTP